MLFQAEAREARLPLTGNMFVPFYDVNPAALTMAWECCFGKAALVICSSGKPCGGVGVSVHATKETWEVS